MFSDIVVLWEVIIRAQEIYKLQMRFRCQLWNDKSVLMHYVYD